MKVSVSLPEEDVEFLDSYARSQSFPSRSAVLHKAVRLLRGAELGPAYEEAFIEWEESGNAAAWEMTTGDGLKADAPG
ncbi:MAG: ribbon-helix-helix domain-containing protein [Candidatus Dormibacteria bacterium]